MHTLYLGPSRLPRTKIELTEITREKVFQEAQEKARPFFYYITGFLIIHNPFVTYIRGGQTANESNTIEMGPVPEGIT